MASRNFRPCLGDGQESSRRAQRGEEAGERGQHNSSALFHDAVGNRPFLVASAVVASLAVAVAGTHFFVRSPIDPVEYQSVPYLCPTIPLSKLVSCRLPPPPPFEDELAPNERLAKAQMLLEDQVYGPECIAVDRKSGRAYAGLKTGLICEIDYSGKEAKIVRAVRLTSLEGCDGSYQSMTKCGRPLGLRYLNDFDFLPDGRLVISESSTKFDDRDFIYDLLEHRPNGRLLLSPLAVQVVAEWMTQKYGLVLKVDVESGRVLESFHDPTGRISDVTTAVEDGRGNLLLGSDANYYVAKLKL
ncbi:hypothetical protein ANCCEY_12069 [Ancylostoma ceylanicum]|uniref:Uncharacterized protein n=1 Tax=Ancylostoma ceylanicum TaxID=53326 RepID=A0A0D6LC85_9BILA|nr:hypothetical protein ANCCEY_12069 [Ancylostoma ceylanicum]